MVRAVTSLTGVPADESIMSPGTPVFLRKTAGGVWPGVPTTRTDIPIIWVGADPSPPVVASRTLNQPGFLDNVDLRLVI